MLKIRINKIIIIILLVSIISVPCYNLKEPNWLKISRNEEFKESDVNNFIDFTIFINDTASGPGAHNWEWASSQEWCTGNGTKSSPFLIENITTECFLLSEYGFKIINSKSYFIIKNCTIIGYYHGISVINSSNGRIIENELDLCDTGLNIENTWNFNISNNFIHRTEYGFKLDNTNNLTISKNKIVEISKFGIYCENSLNLHLINNTIKTIDIHNVGIKMVIQVLFLNVNSCIIIENLIGFKDGFTDIGLYSSNYNLIHNNSILSVEGYSKFILSTSNYNNITYNSIKGESIGIILQQNSTKNRIIYNNISHISDGINIKESHNNSVIMNLIESIASNESIRGNGISVLQSNNNNISNNTIERSNYGIELSSSNYNKIKYNKFIDYIKGCIKEDSCEGNIITENVCKSTYLESNDIGIYWYFIVFLSVGLAILIIILVRIKRKNL